MSGYDAYDTVDMDEVQKQYDASAAKSKVFAPKKVGDYFLVLLPPVVPPGQKGLYYGTYRRHYDFQTLTRSRSAPFSIGCRTSLEQNCFACGVNEAIQAVLPNGDVNEAEDQRRMKTRARVRFISNVLEMDASGKVKGDSAQLWEYSPQTHKDLQSLFSKDAGWGNIADPRNAVVLKVTYKQMFGNVVGVGSVVPTARRIAIPDTVDWINTRIKFSDFIALQVPSDLEIRRFFAAAHAAQPDPGDTSVDETDDTVGEMEDPAAQEPVAAAPWK